MLTLEQGHGPVTDVLPRRSRLPRLDGRLEHLRARAGALAGVNGDFAVQGRLKHLSILDGGGLDEWYPTSRAGVGLIG